MLGESPVKENRKQGKMWGNATNEKKKTNKVFKFRNDKPK